MVPMSDEMITVAARIPLEHWRAIKRLAPAYGLTTTSEILRAAVAEFVHNHNQEGNPQ
jgi:hypothetical protein